MKRSFAYALSVLVLLTPAKVWAHDGPPFPMVVDQTVGPYVVSVWGDPDVGDGTFFIIPNVPAGGSLPEDLKFQVAVQPTNGRLAEVVYTAEREDLRNQVQFKSIVKFDVQELWRVRISLQSSRGNGETEFSVEPTPPGYGSWDLLIYVSPFLALGLLWFVAVIRKRKARAATS